MQNLEKAFPGKEKSWYNRIAAQCYKFYVEDFLEFLSKNVKNDLPSNSI